MAGAGVGGGVASGAAAGAMFGPWGAVIGAGVGLVSGLLAQSESDRHNRAIVASANSQFRAIDANMTSTRVAFYDQTDVRSQQSRQAIAQLQNGQGFTSGDSLNEFVAQQMADTDIDQLAGSKALAGSLQQQQYQKQTIAAQARAGMTSGGVPLLSAVQGGVQGYQIGNSIGSAVDSWQRTAEVNEALQTLQPVATGGGPGAPMATARMQAINAGVPVNQALADNSPFVQPFLINNQLQQLQLNAARQLYGATNNRLESTQQQYDMIRDSLNQYMR